jgi:peroxisomal membrane protein 4
MVKWEDEIQSIVFALIGGARYGIKIRLPHAIVMTCLFRDDLNSSQKLQQIIKIVKEHAFNLAVFASLYKSILLMLKGITYYYAKKINASDRLCMNDVGYFQYYGRVLLSLLGTIPNVLGVEEFA